MVHKSLVLVNCLFRVLVSARKKHAEVTRMAPPPPNRREAQVKERLTWAKCAGLFRVPGRKMAGREGFLGWEVG